MECMGLWWVHSESCRRLNETVDSQKTKTPAAATGFVPRPYVARMFAEATKRLMFSRSRWAIGLGQQRLVRSRSPV